MSNFARYSRNPLRDFVPSYLSQVSNVYSQLTSNIYSCALIAFSSFSLLCLSFGDYSPFSLLVHSLTKVSADTTLSTTHRVSAYVLNSIFVLFFNYQYLLSIILLVIGFLIFNFSSALLVIYLFVSLLFSVLSFSPTVSLVYFHLLFLFPKLIYSRHRYTTLFLLFAFILFDFLQQLAKVNIHLLSPVSHNHG